MRMPNNTFVNKYKNLYLKHLGICRVTQKLTYISNFLNLKALQTLNFEY